MPSLQIKIPEELYNSLKALGYQDQDIEREFLEDVVVQLYSKHVISIGKAASIIGISMQAFRELLLKKHLPVEYLTKDVYEDDLKTIEVKEELLAGEETGTKESDIINAVNEWIKVKEVKDKLAVESLKIHIGDGEAASIILYTETNADLLAINDLKARGIANAMGIKIIGTLGILRLAKDRGMLKQVKPLLDELRKVGAYISNVLYNRMLKDVGEI